MTLFIVTLIVMGSVAVSVFILLNLVILKLRKRQVRLRDLRFEHLLAQAASIRVKVQTLEHDMREVGGHT